MRLTVVAHKQVSHFGEEDQAAPPHGRSLFAYPSWRHDKKHILKEHVQEMTYVLECMKQASLHFFLGCRQEEANALHCSLNVRPFSCAPY